MMLCQCFLLISGADDYKIITQKNHNYRKFAQPRAIITYKFTKIDYKTFFRLTLPCLCIILFLVVKMGLVPIVTCIFYASYAFA